MIFFLSLNRTFLQVTVTVPLYGFNAVLTRIVSGSSNSLAFCRLNHSKQFIITSVLKINCWTVVVLPLISLTDISTMKQASPERCVAWGWDHILFWAASEFWGFCSFAYITGHFCSTAWGDGAGMLSEQSINSLPHTYLQSQNLKMSFCTSILQPFSTEWRVSWCPYRRGFGTLWWKKHRITCLPCLNFCIPKWRSAGTQCLDGNPSPQTSTVYNLEQRPVKVLFSYFIASCEKLLVQGNSVALSCPFKKTLVLHWIWWRMFCLKVIKLLWLASFPMLLA